MWKSQYVWLTFVTKDSPNLAILVELTEILFSRVTSLFRNDDWLKPIMFTYLQLVIMVFYFKKEELLYGEM